MTNRNGLDLKVEILQRASQNGGTRKTHLMRDVGFSCKQVNGHLSELADGGYLKKEGDLYSPTKKGLAFLEGYHELVDKGFGDILGHNNSWREHPSDKSKRPPSRLLVYAKF